MTVEALEARVEALPDGLEYQAQGKIELRQIEVGFINLLDRQPQEPRLRDDLAAFYGHWGRVLETASPAALRLVTSAPDPIRLAEHLHGGAHDLGADLLFAALSQQAGTPDVWLEAANDAGNPAWKIVATEEGARLLAQREGPEMRRLAAAAVESALGLDIAYGQLDRASAMLAGLPAAVRAEVESGASGKVKFRLDDVDLEGDLYDLRHDLLLLSLARGDLTGADRWLAALQPVSLQYAWFRLLEAWRHPPDDPFDVLISPVESREEEAIWGGRNLAPAAVARRGSYPALEARYLRSALQYVGAALTPSAGCREMAPPGIAAAAVALEAEIGALRSRLEERLQRSVEEARAALGPDPAAPVVDRLLRSPLLVKFPEHPLPAGVVPLTPEAIAARTSAASAQVRLPRELDERFVIVRAERRGRRVAVIASSYNYEDCQYWVILSSDGGTTWSRPVSAGQELSRRYTVREGSALRLLAGDHLHVEVERREAEPAAEGPSAGTAPAEGQSGRAVRGIYLDIPIAALERDSDGDGLTDLAEECLVTDPEDPDTDHDGVRDGVDTLPQVASQQAPGPESQALAAMFAAMRWDDQFGGFPAPLDARTQFWVADRQLFTALHLRTRLVVLTPKELDLAEEKLGPFFAREITLFVVDHAGRHGFVIWTSQTQDEAYWLELADGVWKAYLTHYGSF